MDATAIAITQDYKERAWNALKASNENPPTISMTKARFKAAIDSVLASVDGANGYEIEATDA